MISFALAARIIAVVFAVLFVILGFFPAAYAPTFGVVADAGVQFITQRAASMFIAPAVILWVAGGVPRSPLRDAVVLGVCLTCVGIAITGVIAWGQGIAAPPILIAAVLECLMAAVLWVTRKN